MQQVLDDLGELDPTELVDLAQVARVLGLTASGESLDGAASPRGLRLLHKIRACPAPSSSGWSSTSTACRSCSRPASTT